MKRDSKTLRKRIYFDLYLGWKMEMEDSPAGMVQGRREEEGETKKTPRRSETAPWPPQEAPRETQDRPKPFRAIASRCLIVFKLISFVSSLETFYYSLISAQQAISVYLEAILYKFSRRHEEDPRLTGLFAISGSSGKASGGIFKGFWPVFRAVFGQFSGRNLQKKSPNIPLKPVKAL